MIFSLMKAIMRIASVAIVMILLISCQPEAKVSAAPRDGASVVAQAPGSASQKLPAALGYEDLVRLLGDASSQVLLLDVRTPEEYSQGHIEGAALIPYDALETMFKELDKDRPIVLYCRSGNRSSIAHRTLARMGYTNVADFGGINRWRGSLVRP